MSWVKCSLICLRIIFIFIVTQFKMLLAASQKTWIFTRLHCSFYFDCSIYWLWNSEQIHDKEQYGTEGLLCSGGLWLPHSKLLRPAATIWHEDSWQFQDWSDSSQPAARLWLLLVPLLSAGKLHLLSADYCSLFTCGLFLSSWVLFILFFVTLWICGRLLEGHSESNFWMCITILFIDFSIDIRTGSNG